MVLCDWLLVPAESAEQPTVGKAQAGQHARGAQSRYLLVLGFKTVSAQGLLAAVPAHREQLLCPAGTVQGLTAGIVLHKIRPTQCQQGEYLLRHLHALAR